MVLLSIYYLLTVPVAILFILTSNRIHPSHRLLLFGKYKMALNKLRIPTGTSYKGHLAMALKILETPPEVASDIVECGTRKGGSAANLSLVCRLAGRTGAKLRPTSREDDIED